MIRYIYFAVFMLLLSYQGFSQDTLYNENDDYISWSPSYKINSQDFKGKFDEAKRKDFEELKEYTDIYIGIKSVLDVPKKRRDRGKLLEKVYFAPVFYKNLSSVVDYDSVDFKHSRIYLDMAELFSRISRCHLKSLQKKMPGYGTLWNMFATIRNKYCSEFHGMIASYNYEVFREKKEGAHESWRKTVDELLKNYEDFATTPKEIERIYSGKPVEEGYEFSKFVSGPLNTCGN